MGRMQGTVLPAPFPQVYLESNSINKLPSSKKPPGPSSYLPLWGSGMTKGGWGSSGKEQVSLGMEDGVTPAAITHEWNKVASLLTSLIR